MLENVWSHPSCSPLQEYYARFPSVEARHAPPVEHEMACRAEFSGEETFGKYLDLQPFHERATNMRAQFGEPVAYAEFLKTFSHPAQPKGGKYTSYVCDLAEYLEGFLRRTQPLLDVDRTVASDCLEPLQAAWARGEGLGSAGAAASTARAVDLAQLHSAEAVAALGADRLKEGCEALGLKTGGTVGDRAARLFSTKGRDPSTWPKKILAGGDTKRKREGLSEAEKQVAVAEAKVAYFAEQLQDVVEATKRHVDKKHTMLLEERNAELEEEEEDDEAQAGKEDSEEEDDEEDAGEDGPLYNPLNLPLGWDGKPIPYWLFKLHGLGVEYKCEICGNASYFGRKAFDRHFQVSDPQT